MPLFDEHRGSTVAPQDAIVIVHRFVLKCRKWALEKEIPARSQRLAARPDPGEEARLRAWVSYVAFLDHTLRELEEGTLDPWFCEGIEGEGPKDEGNAP